MNFYQSAVEQEKNPFANAVYIKAQQKPSDFSFYDPAPLFRKELEIEEEICEAEIWVQSPGFACFYINGQPITNDVFISPFSEYDRILWYQTYDVTALLRQGKNALGVIAGNGYLNESFDTAWHHCNARWRDAPQFLLCLRVNGRVVLVSDGGWKVSRECSPIIFNHLRSGEYMDARKNDSAWMYAGYDDAAWQEAIVREQVPTGELRLTPCQPIREAEQLAPKEVIETEDGYLLDFGLTMSGYIEITLCEERGREILFYYCEEMDESLHPKHNQMDTPYFYPETPFQLNKLIASGGVDTFKPRFSYHGFRYVLIKGMSKAPQPEAVKAHFVHQDVPKKADFCSGDAVLNFIYRAGLRSTYSNMFWCLTDCPTREKLGWTNDAQATVEQSLINFDIVPLYEKWMEDIKASMRENGALPGIVPSPDWGYHDGPVCDGLLYELPYRIYLYTGDARMLISCIPYFERYIVYLTKRISENYEFALGDWMGYTNSKIIPRQFVRDFYLIKALRITALAHKLNGNSDPIWSVRAEEAKQRFMDTYLDRNGRCNVVEQTSIAMMLEEGLCRDERLLAKQLEEVVLRDECKLTSGMVGVQYLYGALAHSGRADLAYRLIAKSDPGYKTWLDHGATTLWERWSGEEYGSHNHHMFSGVIAWFFKALLGVEPTEAHPAYAELTLSPCFVEEIGFLKGSVQTVKGQIEASWAYEDGHFVYTVDLPDGIAASFCGQALVTGSNRFLVDKSGEILI